MSGGARQKMSSNAHTDINISATLFAETDTCMRSAPIRIMYHPIKTIQCCDKTPDDHYSSWRDTSSALTSSDNCEGTKQ